MKLTIRTQDEIRKTTARQQERGAQDGARTYLDKTDWLVVRQAETGQAVPQDILDQRAAARLLLRNRAEEQVAPAQSPAAGAAKRRRRQRPDAQ